jgi:hypothetical protein
MSERRPSSRGDLMRRMAEVQLQIDTLSRSEIWIGPRRSMSAREFEQQLEALKRLLVR